MHRVYIHNNKSGYYLQTAVSGGNKKGLEYGVIDSLTYYTSSTRNLLDHTSLTKIYGSHG